MLKTLRMYVSMLVATVLVLSLISPMATYAETNRYHFTAVVEEALQFPDLDAKFYVWYDYLDDDLEIKGDYIYESNESAKTYFYVSPYNDEKYEFLGWSINGGPPLKKANILSDFGATGYSNRSKVDIDPNCGGASYDCESLLDLEWIDLVVDGTNPVNVTAKPVFVEKVESSFKLTLNEAEGGEVTLQNVGEDKYTIRATADKYYHFKGWQKNDEQGLYSEDAFIEVTLDQDTTFTPVFEKNSVSIELTDDEYYVQRSIFSQFFWNSLMKDSTPVWGGQRVALDFPYIVTGTGSVEAASTIKVYEGQTTDGQVLAEFTAEQSFHPSDEINYAHIVIDPLPSSGEFTLEIVVDNQAPVVKKYKVDARASLQKQLTYMTTPNNKYMSNVRTEDAGPNVLDMLSFVDEESGKLSLYAAAQGGVMELKGNTFEFMPGIDLPSGDNLGLTGMVVGIGGTKEHLVAVVKDLKNDMIEYSLYDYTPSTGKWIQNEQSIVNDKAAEPNSEVRALVVAPNDVWTQKGHWDGEKWVAHTYNFDNFVKAHDTIYGMSTSSSDEVHGLYSYRAGKWDKIEIVDVDFARLQNISHDGTAIFTNGSDYFSLDRAGIVQEVANLQSISRFSSKINVNIDRHGEIYAFEESHNYFQMGTSGAKGNTIYSFNSEDNEWYYNEVSAFYDPNEYAIGTINYIDKKIRPTTVTTIYNLSDKASIYAGTGGAVYADFDQTTITFNSNGGSEVAPITETINTVIYAPTAPTKAGQYFAGWYLDEELTKAYTFDYMPAKNIELFAAWSEQPIDLTSAKATANQTVRQAYEKYNKRNYDDEGWNKLTTIKEDGLAEIDAITSSFDAVTTAMNKVLAAMEAVPLSETITVAVSMEKFTLGQGYIIEPTLVTIPRNTKASTVITDLIVQKYGADPRPYDLTGTVENSFYLSHVKDGDHNYNIPKYIMDAIKASGQDFTLQNDDWLGEFDFYYMSGWMYAINNVFPGVGASGWTLQNDQVMRWQYTIYGYGSDLDANNKEFGSDALVVTAQKDNLTWRMAEINAMEPSEKAKYQENYDKALAILQNMESTQEEVDNILAALGGTERQAVEVTAEMPAEAKVLDTAIQALPLAIKLADKATVEEIRAAYDALSPTMKQWIWKDTLVLLTNAEEKIAKLEQQVAGVMAQIATLPAVDKLSLTDESAVNTVKNAFSTLSDEQKALVTNADILPKLSNRLDVLKGLEATKSLDYKAINNVIDLVKALPKESELKVANEAKVTAAKKAYDALSKEERNKVTNYNKLNTLVKKLATLKTAAADQKAADEVIDAIDDLPSVSSLKVKDEDDLEEARKLYKALTKEQKALVTNLEDLEDLEKKMKELKKANTTVTNKNTGGGGGGGGSKAPAKSGDMPASSTYITEQSTQELKIVFTQEQMKELATSENVDMLINGTAISVNIPQEVFATELSSDAKFSIEMEKEGDVFQVNFYEISSNGIKRQMTLPKQYVKVTFPLTLFTVGPTASLAPIAQDETGVILRVVDGEYKAVPHQIKNGEVSIYANANNEYVYSTDVVTFADIEQLANKADIEFLASRYVVNGTSDTTFEPSKSITRAQFGVMIARALNLTPTTETYYADTKGQWYEADIQALYEAGITNAPGNFNPGATLSREHAAVFMYRVMNYIQKDKTPTATATAYVDQDQINPNYVEAIATLNALEIMQGKAGNVFDPKGHLTRAQMAKILRKTLEVIDMM